MLPRKPQAVLEGRQKRAGCFGGPSMTVSYEFLSPLILTVARRLGMGVVSVARQLGAIGNLSQLVGSLPCAGGIFPQVLPVLHQDTGHLVKFLGRRHDRIILRVAQADWAGF